MQAGLISFLDKFNNLQAVRIIRINFSVVVTHFTLFTDKVQIDKITDYFHCGVTLDVQLIGEVVEAFEICCVMLSTTALASGLRNLYTFLPLVESRIFLSFVILSYNFC